MKKKEADMKKYTEVSETWYEVNSVLLFVVTAG